VETGDTSEDIEARALLNKFLGASVILHGMEQGGKSPISGAGTASSASLVNQVEKQRARVRFFLPIVSNNRPESGRGILINIRTNYKRTVRTRSRRSIRAFPYLLIAFIR